ncbi:YslB family protein [Planococcus sp. N028]|uniref:YslB family protein n=1 Tax=Planococcus shixiaomingii TaxID=3058393 RepID=A0ABT8MXL1_9BACL|nr:MULTISPECIES: YslB family protein [unclassified Planococcus (in: firmicutes)]MDN7240310.1 YslB family protein [Planococcus sp. N028]WKA56209.1 YslB family protein [Planococcus sp. N022]
MSVSETNAQNDFGYELIRDHVLADILGAHETEILYWAGKSLARKFPLYTLDEAPDFFQQAHFGELTLEKASKDETVFSLKPAKMENRCFKLEAGFLAQQKQKIDGCLTEAYEEVYQKKNLIRITLKTDLRERV